MYHNLLCWIDASQKATKCNWQQICKRVHTRKNSHISQTCFLWACVCVCCSAAADIVHKYFALHKNENRCGGKKKLTYVSNYFQCDKCIMCSSRDYNEWRKDLLTVNSGWSSLQSLCFSYISIMDVWCKIGQSHEPIKITCLVGVKSIWTLKLKLSDAIQYIIYDGGNAKIERAKPTSKPIFTTNCLIDSNGCSATMMFGLSVHCLFACTFRSLYSINCVVTHFVRVQSNLAAAETIQSNKKYLREQNVLESFIARLF